MSANMLQGVPLTPNELTQGTRKWKDNSRQAERKQPNRTGTTPAHTERAHIMNSYRPTARCTTPQPATPHPHQKVAVVQVAKRTERFKHQFFLEPIHKLRCCRALSSLFPQAHLFIRCRAGLEPEGRGPGCYPGCGKEGGAKPGPATFLGQAETNADFWSDLTPN
jgi:hypothetical protein